MAGKVFARSLTTASERHLPKICAPLLQGALFLRTPKNDMLRLSAHAQEDHATVEIRTTSAKTKAVSIVFRDKKVSTLITSETSDGKCYPDRRKISQETQTAVTRHYINYLRKFLPH